MGGGWGNEESFSDYTVLYAYTVNLYCSDSSGGPPLLSGYVCAFHPVVPSSNPKHIKVFSIYGLLYYIYHEEKDQNKRKEAGISQIKKTVQVLLHVYQCQC